MNSRFLSRWGHAEMLTPSLQRAFRNEMFLTYAAISVTLIALVTFWAEAGARLISFYDEARWGAIAELLFGKGLLAFFLLSGLVYQLLRCGYLARFAAHRVAPDAEPARAYGDAAPRLVILVPSYKEESRVVRQTLLAAALQQSPNRRVVLLIDDPPAPGDPDDAARLAAIRKLPGEIASCFSAPARKSQRALEDYLRLQRDGAVEPRRQIRRVAGLLHEAAQWLDRLADDTHVENHNDALFVERILRAPARAHQARARALLAASDPARIDLLLEYRRLAALFKVELTHFERKRYANLSHEPNKAMNLNAYLTLMGGRFRRSWSPEGHILEATDRARATLRVPDADFVIVLDADSLILPEYSLRLLHLITQPGHERIAVVQTPYAAMPGATSEIERIAGATTDVQLMSHQGATLFGAGSWVGASALVRRAALDDIVITVEERGHPVRSYIRDRTLNEDTDTTVDLVRKGWVVYNYPDRLAYSATPPDFGSLLIQRRRWATGGLLILPNVCRYVLDRPSLRRLREGLIRAHYILSAPLGSVGALALMLYPFGPDRCWSIWTLPAFLAYLVTFRRDLIHNGGRSADLIRAVALSAMLLPINLAGAINSIRQLWTGQKIPFQRTPKVLGRTAAAPCHIAAQFGLPLWAGTQAAMHFLAGAWLACLFCFVFFAAGVYALHVFIGWGAAWVDLRVGLAPRLSLPLRTLRDRLLGSGRRYLDERPVSYRRDRTETAPPRRPPRRVRAGARPGRLRRLGRFGPRKHAASPGRRDVRRPALHLGDAARRRGSTGPHAETAVARKGRAVPGDRVRERV